MKQYLQLLKDIKEKGCYKPPARKNMPGTQSLFGYQLRHNLQEGFPLLTTKRMYFKGIVIELLWFLRGDMNIKYLVDNGVNFWNEDAYNYYVNKCKEQNLIGDMIYSFSNFIDIISNPNIVKDLPGEKHMLPKNYTIGDCGYQYGKVWRDWDSGKQESFHDNEKYPSGEWKWKFKNKGIDQIKTLIEGLKNNPESRRHIVTAIDPAHDNDLALYWCHCLFQFNCRPLTIKQRKILFDTKKYHFNQWSTRSLSDLDVVKVPKYYLDCQLYQRSCDVVLGVPFNIASYALLTHIIAKICNMIPGEYIHTFGDVHIYDNHKEQVEEQLNRIPTELPILELSSDYLWEKVLENNFNYNWLMESLVNYNPQSTIKAELSTGFKK